MTIAEVNRLLDQGFSHDEIMSFVQATPPTTAVPEPSPTPSPEPVPVPEPVPEPQPQHIPAQAPANPGGQELQQQLGELTQGIQSLVQLVQKQNILNSQNQVPHQMTAEEAIAQILNPETKQPIGGKT